MSNKEKPRGLTLPVFCQRSRAFWGQGSVCPHFAPEETLAGLTLLFYPACHTWSLRGSGLEEEEPFQKQVPPLPFACIISTVPGRKGKGGACCSSKHLRSTYTVEDQARL